MDFLNNKRAGTNVALGNAKFNYIGTNLWPISIYHFCLVNLVVLQEYFNMLHRLGIYKESCFKN